MSVLLRVFEKTNSHSLLVLIDDFYVDYHAWPYFEVLLAALHLDVCPNILLLLEPLQKLAPRQQVEARFFVTFRIFYCTHRVKYWLEVGLGQAHFLH